MNPNGIDISPLMIGEEFSKYENEFVIVDKSLEDENYLMFPGCDYAISKSTLADVTYMGRPVLAVGIMVENGIIDGIIVMQKVFDIESFYIDVENKYGKISGVTIRSDGRNYSSNELKEMQKKSRLINDYGSESTPNISEYQQFESVIWDDFKTSRKNPQDFLSFLKISVSNRLTIMGDCQYTMEILIKSHKKKATN
ncbi:hypothetical protein [Flagellimonas sp. 2504JD4-2]